MTTSSARKLNWLMRDFVSARMSAAQTSRPASTDNQPRRHGKTDLRSKALARRTGTYSTMSWFPSHDGSYAIPVTRSTSGSRTENTWWIRVTISGTCSAWLRTTAACTEDHSSINPPPA